MAFFREDPNSSFEMPEYMSAHDFSDSGRDVQRSLPLIAAKLQTPNAGDALPRKWLTGVLEKSSRNAAATIIVGRAGTGKTTVAAEFAAGREDVSWYTIDALDSDWRTFQCYFRAAVFRGLTGEPSAPRCETPLDLFADVIAGLELRSKEWPSLLVLDGIHHLFDRPWFHDLFDQLVASMPAHAHALILSRSKPPTPVWRMRSKQVLNVIDEKLLAFSAAEARDFFAHHGVGGVDADAAVTVSFGHAGGLKEIARSGTAAAA